MLEEESKAAAAAFIPMPFELRMDAELRGAWPHETWSMECWRADEDGTCLTDALCEPLPAATACNTCFCHCTRASSEFAHLASSAMFMRGCELGRTGLHVTAPSVHLDRVVH